MMIAHGARHQKCAEAGLPDPAGVAHDRASLDHLRRLKTKFRVLPRSARRETIDFGTELIEERKTSPLAARFIDDG